MRQGNGSDLLGPNDPRSATIGVIYVAPNDDRESVLTAILTHEKLGRKQIAIVLPNQNKAFQQSGDFDDLKNMRRKLQANLIVVASQGSGPVEFARQRHFTYFTSLENYTQSLRDEENGADDDLALAAPPPQGIGSARRGGGPAQDAMQPVPPIQVPAEGDAEDIIRFAPPSRSRDAEHVSLPPVLPEPEEEPVVGPVPPTPPVRWSSGQMATVGAAGVGAGAAMGMGGRAVTPGGGSPPVGTTRGGGAAGGSRRRSRWQLLLLALIALLVSSLLVCGAIAVDAPSTISSNFTPWALGIVGGAILILVSTLAIGERATRKKELPSFATQQKSTASNNRLEVHRPAKTYSGKPARRQTHQSQVMPVQQTISKFQSHPLSDLPEPMDMLPQPAAPQHTNNNPKVTTVDTPLPPKKLVLKQPLSKTANVAPDEQSGLPPAKIPQLAIFVSHSSKDNDFCLKLVKDLSRAIGDNKAIWYDSDGGLQGGDLWWDRIKLELRERSIFIVVLSPNAIASPWVQDEIRIAWRQKNSPAKKRIIPILYRECEVPDDLDTIQKISFLDSRHYEISFNKLLSALGLPVSKGK